MSSPHGHSGPSSIKGNGITRSNLASPSPSHSPRVIPNIPPRASFSSASRPTIPSPNNGIKPIAKASSDSLKRQAISPPTGQSALTAGMASPSPPNSASHVKPALDSDIPTPGAAAGDSGVNTPRGGQADDSQWSNLAEVPDERKAQVLRRHLVSAEERESSKAGTPLAVSPGDTSPLRSGEAGSGYENGDGAGPSREAEGSSEAQGSQVDDRFPIQYDALGSDVTHDLYKWAQDRPRRPTRAASFSHPAERANLDPSLANIKEPGGFRRNFVVNRAIEQGAEPPTMVRNVVDFLYLYGHFAGEDLGEDEDEDDEDEDGLPTFATTSRGGVAGPSGERAPLLGSRSASKTKHKRAKSGPPVGTASTTQAVLMLLKGFVGTGILFMAKAFLNGGLLFSTIVMTSIAGISLWSFLLLMQAYMVVPGSFGDMGGALYGPYMRISILISITVSQIGFVCAYTIFIAQNLQAFVLAVTDCKTFIPTRWMILAELAIFLPLAMVRNLAKLSGTALVADAFILIGIVYIASNEFSTIAKNGVADVVMFNRDSFPLLVGTAVFAFEGVGLVIPITQSMKEPKKFPGVLSAVMLVVAILFGGAGAVGYMAYGSDIQTVVLVNLPQDDKFVQAVQFLYSIAILLSIPLQLFPAVRIMENGRFSRSGKHNPRVKWQKNLFRAGAVIFCSLLSWASSSELDKFVSLIGAFACVPLCFIYPAMLHLKACAKTRSAIIIDWVFIIFGSAVGLFTTVQTLRSLAEPSQAPSFGKCDVPPAF